MKLKRKLIFSGAIIFAVLLFVGCAIQPSPRRVTFDPHLPREQTSTVHIRDTIFVLDYNDINVQSDWYRNNRTRAVRAALPAGQTSLRFNVRAVFSRQNINYRVRLDDITINHSFEAGREYTIGLHLSPNQGTLFNPRNTVILTIWEGHFSQGRLPRNHQQRILRAWEIAEF